MQKQFAVREEKEERVAAHNLFINDRAVDRQERPSDREFLILGLE